MQRLLKFSADQSKRVLFFRLGLFLTMLLFGITAIYFGDSEFNKREQFLVDLDLTLKLQVSKVTPTNNHGFGVMYGSLLSSNKPGSFNVIYNKRDTFCKIEGKRILMITAFELVQPNDILTIDSKKLRYRIYRNNKLYLENKLILPDNFMLYRDIKTNGLFDLNIYKKPYTSTSKSFKQSVEWYKAVL